MRNEPSDILPHAYQRLQCGLLANSTQRYRALPDATRTDTWQA
ncbi:MULTISPECIES: hypothetical protein [unclassified Moorena]|nr:MULTISPECIES: hypothetical protein [unclassified Moorena]